MLAPRPARPTGLWLLVIAAFAASAAFVGWRLVGPSDGAAIAFYGDVWRAEGIRVDRIEGRPAGLQQGDVVIGVAGRPLNSWLDDVGNPAPERIAPESGQSIVYTVSRDGTVVDVSVTLATRDVSAYLLDNWSNLLFAAVLLVVALYVLWRRPELSAARALAIAATAAGASITPWLLGPHVSDIYFGWPYILYAVTVNPLFVLLVPAGALHLPLAMMPGPNGATTLSRLRLVAIYAIPLGGYALGLVLARLMVPTTSAWIGTWPTLQGLVFIPSIVVGNALAVLAYRRAGPDAQRQIRWALLGGSTATVVVLVLLFVPQLVTGRPLVSWSVIGLILLPFPIGLAVAIVRHRLFDVEVVVNRTLVYGGLTLAILATYVGAVSVLGAFLGVGDGFGVSLLATGVAALVALPVRDVLQRSVNRLMYGDRDDPYRALVRLGHRLEATLDPIEGPSVVVRTVADSLRVPWAALRVGPAEGGGRLFEHGRRPAGEVLDVPLLFGAEVVGHLLVGQRSPREPLSAADRRLLSALARQAGVAIHALSLTFELVDSRQRIVAAREEERRRIRRDLHDGLGPTLAAIGMRAEVAAELTTRDPESAESMLVELRDETQGALAEIRRLVDALRPPALDELGLVGAVSQQADRLGGDLRIQVNARGGLPELPAAVEVAAYRIAAEAMTNAVRHSAASRCDVMLHVDDTGQARALVLEVVDDGRGLPAQVEAGVGLRSMRERAAEVGGLFEVSPAAPRGTRLMARLPLDESISLSAQT